MQKIIKFIFPEFIKKKLRVLEDVFRRISFSFSKPIILKDYYDSFFVLYPKDKTPIRWLLSRSSYKKEFYAIKKLVNPGNIVFDVGANIGVLTSFFAKIVGYNGLVFSFEPFLNSYKKLETSVAINKYTWVSLYKMAISDYNGESDFYFDDSNYELNSLGAVSNGFCKLESKVRVEVNSLDSFCLKRGIDNIDFLKIDVEGFEENVLNGSFNLLNNKNIKFIQFEVSLTPLKSLNKNPENLIKLLSSYDYRVYEFNESLKKFKLINSIASEYDNYYASYIDLENIN